MKKCDNYKAVQIIVQMSTYMKIAIIIIGLIGCALSEDTCNYCSHTVKECLLCYSNCSQLSYISCESDYHQLSEKQCTSICCGPDVTEDKFTPTSLNNCLIQDTTSKTSETRRLLAIVIGTLLLALLIIIISRSLFKSFKNRQIRINNELGISRQNLQGGTVESSQVIDQPDLTDALGKQGFTMEADDIIKEGSVNCCICLENGVTAITKCVHAYHIRCIQQWYIRSTNCPLCNQNNLDVIREYCPHCRKFLGITSLKKKQMSIIFRAGHKCD